MRTLICGFLVLFILSPVFGATNLLRLERSEVPGGPWQEVPANVLPITVEGAFEDTYESATGYYRMRIDPGVEWGFPLNIPLEDVSPMAVGIAEELLGSSRDLEGWEDALLGPIAFPMYTPGIDGPSYMEFALLSPGPEYPDYPFQDQVPLKAETQATPTGFDCLSATPRGFILVSLTEDDFPVVEYSTEGTTRTECLRKRARTSAVRIIAITDSLKIAENGKEEVLAYEGEPPLWYPDEILEYDRVFEGEGSPDGENNPDPPPFEGEPYTSYEAFKKDYMESKRFEEGRKRRREAAREEWDVVLNRLPEVLTVTVGEEKVFLEQEVIKGFSVDDPALADIQILATPPGLLIVGKQPGQTPLQVIFENGSETDYMLLITEQGALSPQQPTGWSPWEYWYTDAMGSQRCYDQEWGGMCWSGCGPTAWALIYGWWDHSGKNTALIDGVAPLYNNDAVRACIWYIVAATDTFCFGTKGVTFPWKEHKGYNWAKYRHSFWSYHYKWTWPCFGWTWNGPRDLAINTIKSDSRPVIIGIGCASAHYAVAYQYKYRRYTLGGVTWCRQRRFKCNMGWGCSKLWKNAKGTWYACKASF